jgi:hypothetical protein
MGMLLVAWFRDQRAAPHLRREMVQAGRGLHRDPDTTTSRITLEA